MKFEKINENKLKITLNSEDLKRYDITAEKLAVDANSAQDFLHILLRRAEDFGFYANGEQIMIEAGQLRGDTFTIFITKITNPQDAIPHFALRTKRQPQRPKSVMKKGVFIFRFDSFDDLEHACLAINPEFISKSNLYKLKEKFYLVLTVKHPSLFDFFETKFSDFGRKEENPATKEGELIEHGTLMIENDAIGVIRCYFGKK